MYSFPCIRDFVSKYTVLKTAKNLHLNLNTFMCHEVFLREKPVIHRACSTLTGLLTKFQLHKTNLMAVC